KKLLGPIFRFKTETWVSQKFRGYVEKAGFKGHSFHDLRHAFGTTLVKASEDIRTIQKLMRHESIQSTLVYAKVLPEHLIKASNNLNYGFSAEDVIKKKQELKKTGT
ncbi:MAG: tyrosine-type recombinase/integrase, partial [Desulfobulbales bacterium]